MSKILMSLSTHLSCCRLGTQKVYRFFQRIVREVVTYRENNNITRADYMQHLITLSKKGSVADDKDVSNGDVSQQNSTYTPRVSTCSVYKGSNLVTQSDDSKLDVNLSPSAARVAFRGSNGPNVIHEKTLFLKF